MMHNPFSPSWRHSILGLVCFYTLAFAQTYTDCNPILKNCPSDPGLQASQYAYDFRNGPDYSHWSGSNGPITYTPFGAALSITQKGDSPTLTSAWYFFFGRVEVRMRAASGTGIISCIVLESDDLDEIDWEWIGGDRQVVQTNYFGKGNTTTYDRGGYSPIADAQGVTHVYTIDWTPSLVTWYINGAPVRTLAYVDAVYGRNYPQTPMRVKIGIWAGGDSGNANGTIAWAGGLTNYTQGPFTMYLESVSVTNMYPAASYIYKDMSGSWQSIAISNSPAPQPVSGTAGKDLDTSDAANSTTTDQKQEAIPAPFKAPTGDEDFEVKDGTQPAPFKPPTRKEDVGVKDDTQPALSKPPIKNEYVEVKEGSEPAPFKSPTKNEDVEVKDGTQGLSVATKSSTAGFAASFSAPHHTDESNPNHAVDTVTITTSTVHATKPPNIISSGNSIQHLGLGVYTAVWGFGIVFAMTWGAI